MSDSSATRKDIKEMADRLISTLDNMMPSEKADAIVQDVATELYTKVLRVPGKIVLDDQQPAGFLHGSFGQGKRMMTFGKFKFKAEEPSL